MERVRDRAEASGIRVEIPEEPSQKFLKRTGVVLSRGRFMEGNLSVFLFLKDTGTVRVYVPGAGRGSQRYGGSLEPLVWARYQLYQSRRRMYIKEVDVTEDLWQLRQRPDALRHALRWCAWLQKNLIEGYPYNNLLILFYWALHALVREVPPDIVTARFLWRWLLDWGIAPDLLRCSVCGHSLDGTAKWNEGAFVCTDCGQDISGAVYKLDTFARYAHSKSFITQPEQTLSEQARPLGELFIKNIEDNR